MPAARSSTTGLHARGWSRQRAVDYLRDNTAMADIQHEVDRYIAEPAQAPSYIAVLLSPARPVRMPFRPRP